MKKIMSTIAMACLSFSCLAESYFVKIADNEYVLQHREKSKDLWIDNSVYRAVYTRAVYTPTHVFTYPDETPSLFRNIQKIEYTKSNVTFYKDIKTRKCCIDILDDKENANKCRIIGMNGHEIINIKDPNIGSFEVYEVADEANSFTDSTPRLIYVDHTGLYIVSEKENPIEDISKNYFLNRKFDFKGEIIKISAVDGKREIPKCAFEWSSDAPVSFEESMLSVKPEFIHIMGQIKEIAGVMPKSTPPTFEAARKRIAELLNIPESVLVMNNGRVQLKGAINFGIKSNDQSVINYNNIINQLKKFEGLMPSFSSRSSSNAKLYQGITNYKFDTSPAAQQRRKEIALKPWDK